MTYKQIYQELLNYCKENNIIVRSIRMSLQYYGEYDYEENRININNRIRSFKVKCTTLAHEIAHALDYKYGNYSRFFKDLGRYTHKKMLLVAQAECSASYHAREMLKYYGKKNIYFEELDRRVVKSFLIPVWRQIYFAR